MNRGLLALVSSVSVLALVAPSCASDDGPPIGVDAAPTTLGETIPPSTAPASTAAPLPEVDPAIVPSQPGIAPTTGFDPTQRAQELLAATADDAPDAGAGWMALYADVGIPVVTVGGASTITDDPVGPTWDQVWSFAGLSQGGATIPLADAERILSLVTGDDSPMPPGTMLEDLRASAGATDPRAQLIARFVAGRSVEHGFADPLDAASTGDSVGIDAATLSLLLWAGLRDGMIAAAGDGANGLTGFTGRAPLPQRPTARTSICSTPTDEEGWVLWLEKLAGGGLDIKGVGYIPGVSQFFTQAFGNRAGTASKALAGAGVVVSLISLIAMLKSMNVTGQMSPSPLERNKDRSDGKQATITITLSFDSKAKGTAAELACAANVLARGLGLELTLPIDGAPISGSDVLVTAGKNFPDKIYFADAASTRVTTDASGHADIEVQGHAREKELPDTATKIDDTFGIRIAAQVEGESLQSIIDTFIGGLTLSGAGAIGSAINVAKTVRYDLGEQTFPFTDWQADSFRVDQPMGQLTVQGVVCSLEQPFSLGVSGMINGALNFVPSSPDAGSYEGGAPEVYLEWSGLYTVDRSNPDAPTIALTETQTVQNLPGLGPVQTGDFFAGQVVNLLRDETACST